MDKTRGIRRDSLTEDFAFIKRLQNASKSHDSQIWLKFCTEDIYDDIENEEKQSMFRSHPRNISSNHDILDEPERNTSHQVNLNFIPPYKQIGENEFVSTSDDLFATNVSRRALEKDLNILHGHRDEPKRKVENTPPIDEDAIRRRVRELYPPLSQSTIKSVTNEKNKKIKLKSVKGKKVSPFMKNLANNRQKVKNYLVRLSNNASPKLNIKKDSVPTSQRSNMSSSTGNSMVRIAIQKCLDHITNIRSLIEKGIDIYEGDDDLPRRIKRMKEFSARFSRIYLYPLMRQLDDLRSMKPQSALISQRMVATFHVIERALQAYHNHLPSSAGNCAYDKMKSLLSQSLDSCTAYESLLSTTYSDDQKEYIEAFRHHIELLNEDIEYNFSSNKLIPKAAKENRVPRPIDKIRKPKKKGKLAMYHVTASFRKDADWEKTVDLITKKKYNVKSRYRTAIYKHRPPIEKVSALAVSEKSVFPSKQCLPAGQTTPLTSPMNEEEITTMVQVQNEKEKNKNRMKGQSKENLTVPTSIMEESEDEKSKTWDERLQKTKENVNQECVTVKLLQLLRDKCKVYTGQSDNTAEDNGTLEFLRNCIANPTGENKEILNTLIKELDNDENKQKFSEKLPNTTISTIHVNKCMKNISEISVTGPKNAKLYCIRDDRPVTVENDQDIIDCNRRSSEILHPLKAVSTSETQTDVRGEEKRTKSTQKSSRSSVKISRLPKANLRQLKLLESSQAVNIIQYKLDFKAYSKKNPMYDRTTVTPPWIITGRISDKLLEDALMSVTKEMEIDGLLENIYKAEFQY